MFPKVSQNERCFRSGMESDDEKEDDQAPIHGESEGFITDYFTPNTVCAIAAEESSCDMFYFIHIEDSGIADFDIMDDYNHLITKGQKYISGFYREKKTETSKGITYSINTKKSVYFYSESIIYPFVNFQEKPKSKKGIMFLSASDYCDVLCFVQKNRMAAIV